MYTLQLLTLQCITAQENDGDEPFLLLDGVPIWSSMAGEEVSHLLINANRVSEYDFAARTKHTRDGWQQMEDFELDALTFPTQTRDLTLELREKDRFTDDLLGTTVIREVDAGRGEIAVQFQGEGAIYRLTYVVQVEG